MWCHSPAFQPICRYTPTGSKPNAWWRATLAGLGLEGDGTLADGGDLSGGRHRWLVTAPATPGAAVLTVLLDGVALKVRPRVRFLAMP